jgi:hypothetical protein
MAPGRASASDEDAEHAGLARQVVERRVRDGGAVVRGGAAAQLVEQQQRARRELAERLAWVEGAGEGEDWRG